MFTNRIQCEMCSYKASMYRDRLTMSVKAHKLSHTTQDVTVFTTQKQQIKGEADLLK